MPITFQVRVAGVHFQDVTAPLSNQEAASYPPPGTPTGADTCRARERRARAVALGSCALRQALMLDSASPRKI